MTNHLGGSNFDGDWQTYTPDIWGWLLLSSVEIRSVIDIGCGYGHNAKWFLDMGCDTYGVDGDPDVIAVQSDKKSIKARLPRDRIIVHDYTTGPYVPDREFDLGICTEFVEHVEAEFEQNWLATVKKCRLFLMCHAVPGQAGHHHVNLQEDAYWIERLEDAGLEYMPLTSQMLRATCSRKPSPWGRNTLMLFERKT